MKESVWSSKCKTFNVSGSYPRERPRRTWNEVIRNDLKKEKPSKERNAWKSFIRNSPTHVSMENRC